MIGVGYIDSNGFLESAISPEIISFEKENTLISKAGLSAKIAEIGNRMAADSNLIREVHPTVVDGGTGFEVILKEKVRPVNLQGFDRSKKFLKLDLSKEGTVWKWEDGHDPTVSVFVFKLFGNRSNEDQIPVGGYAYAGKSGKNYLRTWHPNVGDGGGICMGGYQGHENLAELSIRGLCNMLRNEAIYSSFRKPNIVYLPSKVSIHMDASTINAIIDGKKDQKMYDYVREFATVEEWL
jgi:hypothetical protein